MLPARLDRYEPSMLDMLCLAGEAGWARLSRRPPSPEPAPSLVPATPIALFLREHADAWQTLRTADATEPPLGDEARRVLSTLRVARRVVLRRSARRPAGSTPISCGSAIGALVACGLVTSDGFSGLRALVWAARGRPAPHDRRSNFAGRWTRDRGRRRRRRRRDDGGRAAGVGAAAPLRRRVPAAARRARPTPRRGASWRASTAGSRRAARSAAAGSSPACRASSSRCRTPSSGCARSGASAAGRRAWSTISAADPLNLAGIVTAGERIRTAGRNRIVYRDGVPLAVVEGDFVRELAPIDPRIAADVSRALKTRPRAGARHPLGIHGDFRDDFRLESPAAASVTL